MVVEENEARQTKEPTDPMDEFTYLRSEKEERASLERSEVLNHSVEPALPRTHDDEIRELNAIFDEVLAELIAEEADAARAGKPVHPRREAAPESAGSIEDAFMEDVHKRLHELFPKGSAAAAKDGTLEPPEFDEELYKKLIPLFTAILNHVQKTET